MSKSKEKSIDWPIIREISSVSGDYKRLNDFDIDSDNLNEQRKKAEIKRYGDDSDSRKQLTRWIKYIVSIWLGIVILLLVINGFSFWCFNLSDMVLIALLGTTTFNVLGLSYIVLKGLFQEK